MTLCDLRYYSPALEKETGATVVLPPTRGVEPAPAPPFPVFYLLHGLSDDYSAWTRRSNIERYAEDYPFIVVMPDGGRGFYTDARDGYAYETAIVRDLVGLVDSAFRTDARREARVIGGLSMGGYGALRLALRHPDLFCSATSHSGALAVAHRRLDLTRADEREFSRIFGPDPNGGPDDLFALAEGIDRSRLPALRIDCGTDDFLLNANRRFDARLTSLGIDHEYEEFPGAHTWDYWDQHVRDALAFHARSIARSGGATGQADGRATHHQIII